MSVWFPEYFACPDDTKKPRIFPSPVTATLSYFVTCYFRISRQNLVNGINC